MSNDYPAIDPAVAELDPTEVIKHSFVIFPVNFALFGMPQSEMTSYICHLTDRRIIIEHNDSGAASLDMTKHSVKFMKLAGLATAGVSIGFAIAIQQARAEMERRKAVVISIPYERVEALLSRKFGRFTYVRIKVQGDDDTDPLYFQPSRATGLSRYLGQLLGDPGKDFVELASRLKAGSG